MSRKSDKTKNEDDGTGRIGRLDEPTMGYYRRVSDKIQEGFENTEEKGRLFCELRRTRSHVLDFVLDLESADLCY